ncbi:MAG: type II toxin-antitoxin system RelE/ParE family toxin [Proteobacteria bacterium]|nr:type II toxin-antitoxin system RelE/ParE family toxin [Pseudomonadota bacterium]
MLEVRQMAAFTNWLAKLTDRDAQARIVVRLRRFELGNLGDVKPVGEGVMEARIDYGPGYRLYFVRRGLVLIVMLCGGDKRTQRADIERARKLAKEL